MRVTRFVEFDTGHRVPSHAGKCRNLHGHRFRVGVTVEGDVQAEGVEDGMVIDFGRLADALRAIHDQFDHRLLLFTGDPLLEDPGFFRAVEGHGLVLTGWVPTAENLANQIAAEITWSGLNVVEVEVWETPQNVARWSR
jgi:6-pyruvoyltetrahydropterin/6-carboxytetrahydropterin synthase